RLLETGYASDLRDAYDKADRLNPAPHPAASAAPPPPVQTRPALSITGAPGAGSDPDARRASKTRSEAIARGFSRAGLA
ncbi:MAG: hypothetical protein AAF982_03900, partial [Pseudomonadota bacterium]